MSKLLSVSKQNGIAKVTIENPPMNVLSEQVTKELDEVFQDIKTDDTVIAVILTGSGDKAFMAGADIKEFPDRAEAEEAVSAQEVFNFIVHLPKPTIAMLNGYTLGGGLELALTCDIRIAEDHAKLGLPEVTLGLLPGAGGTQRLPRLVGTAAAKEFMFTGKQLSAEEAQQLSLVNQVVPQGEGMQTAEKLAATMAKMSLQALSRIKQLINTSEVTSLEEGLRQEEQQFNEIFKTEDAKEGVQAFIEKRAPVFKHR